MASLRSLRRSNRVPLASGNTLVADFTTAINNLVTAETATYIATQTEAEAMQTIQYAAAQNNVFVTPQDMSPEQRAQAARSSLDAHLQKAQAGQISAFTEEQIMQMEQTAKATYVGKKIKVTIIDTKIKPVESYWVDSKTGRSRKGTVSFKSVSGVIEDIALRKNALILKPTRTSRLLAPGRKFFFVYVVNPETLKPAVSISLL